MSNSSVLFFIDCFVYEILFITSKCKFSLYTKVRQLFQFQKSIKTQCKHKVKNIDISILIYKPNFYKDLYLWIMILCCLVCLEVPTWCHAPFNMAASQISQNIWRNIVSFNFKILKQEVTHIKGFGELFVLSNILNKFISFALS